MQRSYAVTEERIEQMLMKGALNSIYDEGKVAEFENACVAISEKDKKALKKFYGNKTLFDAIFEKLRANLSDKVYPSPEPFLAYLVTILNIDKS